MNKINLKPCPCCGTEAYTRITSVIDDTLKGYISCNNSQCLLRMNFEIKASDYLLSFDDVINGINDVIDKWNRRTNECEQEDKDIVKNKDSNTDYNIDVTNYNKLKIGEVIYTKSSKCILDIGLIKSIKPFTVYARCSKYNEDNVSYYGYPEGCKWYDTGIYKTYDEWKNLTMDKNRTNETRSTEEICNILGISYWQKDR